MIQNIFQKKAKSILLVFYQLLVGKFQLVSQGKILVFPLCAFSSVSFFLNIDLHIFLHSSLFLPSPLLPSPMTPKLAIYSVGSCLFLLPMQFLVCLSQGPLCCLGSLGLWIVGWFFFALCLKATYYICLSGSGLQIIQ